MKNIVTKTLATAFCAASFAGSSSAALVSVFQYDADASVASGSTPSTLTVGSAVTDVSGAGNNGIVIGSLVSTVEDDPFNATGQLSFSFPSTTDNRINTNATLLLTVANVAANGGYTMSTHFKTSQTIGFGQFLAYAGTNGFRSNGAKIEFFSLDDIEANHQFINLETLAGKNLQDNAWHQVTMNFDTRGNQVVGGKVAGFHTFTIDGITYAPVAGNLDDVGQKLNRSISVGGRSAGGDQFNGLVYNPSVALGIPEPSSALLLGLAGLTLLSRRRR